MPTSVGPNPSADNSIVFSYDVGDTSNSYIGEPTVNYYGDIDTSIALRTPSTEYNTSNWTANFSKPPLNIGRVYKHTSGALSSTWSGNSYGYTLKYYTYPAGAIYTLSAWVYVSPDCNISQLNVSIEGGGSWIDYNYQYDLNNKGTWQRIWLEINTLGGFAGNAIPIYPQRWGVTDGSFTGFYAWGGVMLEAKDHITQYTVGTRSATQGLLPLINNPTIDLSSVSFDSNAQIIWDGTDDTISINSYSAIELVDNVSIECVYMRLSTDPVLDVIANKYNGTGWELFCQTSATFALAGRNGDGTYYATSNPAYTIQNNQYYHLVAIKDGFSWRLYVNGQLYSYLTAGTIGTWSNSGILQIGGEGSGYYPHMKLPIFKIYNTVLSTDQVQQNYRQYKSRFNLS